MGLFGGAKNFVTRGLGFRLDKWMSIEYIQETFDRTRMILSGIMTPKKSNKEETFEEALDRLGLSEEDLEQRRREFVRLTISFGVIGVIVLGYGFYMLIQGHPWITLITAFLSIYAFSQAFHFHFWLFQIKNRKLGCSVMEWFNSEIRPRDDSNTGSTGE